MTVETFEHNGFTVKILHDSDPISPREWDNVGEMICFHRRYAIGDRHKWTPEEFQEFMDENPQHVFLPVYMYDHGNVALSTSTFSCRWDSGQVGWVYATCDKVKKEFNGDRDKAVKCLQAEVEDYSQYVSGEVYGYEIYTPEGEFVDSCFGFFGMKYVTEAARESASMHKLEMELDWVI